MNELEAERAAEKARKAGVKQRNPKRSVVKKRERNRLRGVPVPASTRNERRSKKVQAQVSARFKSDARLQVEAMRRAGAPLADQWTVWLMRSHYEVPVARPPMTREEYAALVGMKTYRELEVIFDGLR